MQKFHCLLFLLKQSYISYYIISMTVPLIYKNFTYSLIAYSQLVRGFIPPLFYNSPLSRNPRCPQLLQAYQENESTERLFNQVVYNFYPKTSIFSSTFLQLVNGSKNSISISLVFILFCFEGNLESISILFSYSSYKHV